MKQTLILISVFVLGQVAAHITTAHADMKHQAMAKQPDSFAALKKLEGTWQGTSMMEGKETPVTIEYKLIAGDTVLMENLFPGTKHAMVSMYHAEGDKKVVMTHYCAHGNQPKLTMQKSTTPNEIYFKMVGVQGIKNKNEPHMGAVKFTFTDDQNIVQEWTAFDKGKQSEVKTFKLTKKL